MFGTSQTFSIAETYTFEKWNLKIILFIDLDREKYRGKWPADSFVRTEESAWRLRRFARAHVINSADDDMQMTWKHAIPTSPRRGDKPQLINVSARSRVQGSNPPLVARTQELKYYLYFLGGTFSCLCFSFPLSVLVQTSKVFDLRRFKERWSSVWISV